MDRVSKQTRSRIMSAIKSKGTKPELILRSRLRAAGIDYRVNYGQHKIDIAIPPKKIAIFVDGCFWHQCPKHSHIPKGNRDYWLPKLKNNIKRDRQTTRSLELAGWMVVRIWEHELDNQTKNAKKLTLYLN